MNFEERLVLIKQAHSRQHISEVNATFSIFRPPEDEWDEYLIELPKKGYWTASIGGEHSIPIRHEESFPSSLQIPNATENQTNHGFVVAQRAREAERMFTVEREEKEKRDRITWTQYQAKNDRETRAQEAANRALNRETTGTRFLRKEFLVKLRDSVGRETDSRIIIDPEKHCIQCQVCGQEDLLLFLIPLTPPKVIEIAAKFCMKHDHCNTEES